LIMIAVIPRTVFMLLYSIELNFVQNVFVEFFIF